MISNDRILEIQSRLEKATPGPWVNWGRAGEFEATLTEGLPVGVGKTVLILFEVRRNNDAIFVEHAKSDMQFLLDELRKFQ